MTEDRMPWCPDIGMKPMKLDIACGANKAPGFWGIDQTSYPGVDMVWNLDEFPWPFDDNSVDEIRCEHFIEHCADLVRFMEELWRIMRPGAIGRLVAPWWNSINTWRDPTHRRGIADQTLNFFDAQWRAKNGKQCYKINADFEVGYQIEIDPGFKPVWDKLSPEDQRFALNHYVNVGYNIHFEIKKRGA